MRVARSAASAVFGARSVSLGARSTSPDKGGLAEYSVVYTDRAVNHMSSNFQSTMNNLNVWLKDTYNAKTTLLMPGSGTTGMEAVARQYATDKKVMVVRNGFFSYRWTQIFDTCKIPSEHIVHKAERIGSGDTAPFQPVPIEKLVASIKAEKPAVVFCPHVETSAGIIVPDDYVIEAAKAVHEVGGIFVLDGIASGCEWIDMKKLDIDVYITAPQKGWSAPASAGIVMLGERADDLLTKTQSTSFIVDLNKWKAVMQAYEGGAHMYHCTMPTDALMEFERMVQHCRETIGLDKLKAMQNEIGRRTVECLEAHGTTTVAAEGFRAPSVVVAYTSRDEVQNGSAFKARGMQIAGGVPLFVDEGPKYKTFRLGMLGIDKLTDIDGTIANLDATLKDIGKIL